MTVVEVNNVSKMFRLGVQSNDLREKLGGMFARSRVARNGAAQSGAVLSPEKPAEFWALQDISFAISEGESFGIIGHNGSGKSTLLKMITGIYKPTKGQIRTRGRISALIEVGAGFHPDLTGRENIYLNGSVLGMKRREIDRRFDEIVAFAELEQFIDTPVKRYSSGMYMRLGFAVAAHIDPEIVLVDEVLAVGDESFRKKCMDKMLSLRREGRTIVFISHSMDAVAAMCQRVMLLNRGHAMAIGEPREVINAYRTSMAAMLDQKEHTAQTPDATETPDIEILEVRLLDRHGRECDTITLGDPLRVEFTYRANVRVENPAFGVGIYRQDGLYLFGANTAFDDIPMEPVEGVGRLGITYSSLPMLQGVYKFSVASYRHGETNYPIHSRRYAATLTITSSTLSKGIVELPHQWEGTALETRRGSSDRALTHTTAAMLPHEVVTRDENRNLIGDTL